MKEFMVIVRCEDMQGLADKLEATARDLRQGSGPIDGMGVDEQAESDAPGCEGVTIQRCE